MQIAEARLHVQLQFFALTPQTHQPVQDPHEEQKE
jgi:hypothetical protein